MKSERIKFHPKETFLDSYPINNYGVGRSLLILALFFIGMMLIAATIIGVINGAFTTDTLSALYLSTAVQAILGFLGTAILTAAFISKRPMTFLKLTSAPSLKSIIGIILAYIIAIPAMNQIIFWNANWHLPENFSGLEESLRQLENVNAAVTSQLLSGDSVFSLFISVLIVGVLTGISEEILFRGTLQQIIGSKGAQICAIWISAFIFSSIHFQFFGFLPRLLLGAWFGYILLWTGSTWNCAVAHTLNNSIVVIATWLANRGVNITSVDNWGVVESEFPVWALISSVLFAGFLIFGRKFFFNRQ